MAPTCGAIFFFLSAKKIPLNDRRCRWVGMAVAMEAAKFVTAGWLARPLAALPPELESLGQTLKPFVFLDIFAADKTTIHAIENMPVHPHSGIATVTVFAEGYMRYADRASGSGTLEYGGVEWMRAGRGVWHGKEMSPGDVQRLQS
jgi:hypothetical protein